MDILKEFNLEFKKNKVKFKLRKENGSSFSIQTYGAKFDDKMGMGISIRKEGQSTPCRNLSLHINDDYHQNVAEIGAIITALKVLPENATAQIFTNSQVADSALTLAYKGKYLPLTKEYNDLVINKNLSISIRKMKKIPEATTLACDGSKRDKMFDIRSLMTKQRSGEIQQIPIYDLQTNTTMKTAFVVIVNAQLTLNIMFMNVQD